MNNNNQNEQAQVQTTSEQTSKPKRKPLFQEGTFLYKITYGFTAKVKAGEISFAKVFWVGLLINVIFNIIIGTIFASYPKIIPLLIFIFGIKYTQLLWYARNSIYNKTWFYIGFGLVLTGSILMMISFLLIISLA